MQKSYYRVWYRLDRKDRYLIWYTILDADGDMDGVVLDTNGKIPVFVSLEALSAYAGANNFPLEEQDDLSPHNLDAVKGWFPKMKRSKPEGPTAVNCVEFLNAWNLFSDISRSISGDFDPDRERTHNLYYKLFRGSNLPSLTPKGRCYIPLWPGGERRLMREIMSHGLQIFRDRVRLHR